MDLKICDPKKGLWSKAEKIEEVGDSKFSFEVQNCAFEINVTLKNIVGVTATIPAQFQYKIILLSNNIDENCPKSIKIDILIRNPYS